MRELTLQTPAGPQSIPAFEASTPQAPVAVCLPALGIDARYYTPLAEALAAGGAHALLVDFPGRGSSPMRARRGTDWGHAELVAQCHATRELVRTTYPKSRFYWLGHSLGGHVALMHAGLYPDRVDGVVLVASGTPYFARWPLRERAMILAATQALGFSARLLGFAPGKALGLGENEPAKLLEEWAFVGRHGHYPKDDFDAEDAMSACRCPILSITLAGDRLAPQAAIDHNLQKLRSSSVERWTWTPDPPLSHNRWPRAPQGAAERVLQWLSGSPAAAPASSPRG